MSSIIEGYNYDIFISYRLRDNKGEKWVTEFVEALKTELESTFKDDISIYFDENPHDGLLETHDVDASLRDKLKCLIFIPVISRIYCDPKAFAWVHEFMAFVEIASQDRFGLKVNLPNGNIASRVLPIKIHELDPEDTGLCESLLGGVLRGVDFIYKSPGVNRPLRMKEEHPADNLNKTYYRDQINKTANAVVDLINGIRSESKSVVHGKGSDSAVEKQSVSSWFQKLKYLFPALKFRWRLIILASVLIFSAALITLRYVKTEDRLSTIAILPLLNVNNDITLRNDETSFIAGLTNKLANVKSITVIPDITTEQYRNSGKSTANIWRDLKTDYLLDGKIRHENDAIVIWLQLSERKNNKVIWASSLKWNHDKYSELCKETAMTILGNMNIRLSDDEKKRMSVEPEFKEEDNLLLLSADKIVKDAWSYYNYSDTRIDTASYMKAIASYSRLISMNPDFALAYAKRSIARSLGYQVKQLDTSSILPCKTDFTKALELDRNLNEGIIAKGFYYFYCLDSLEKALECFTLASLRDRDNYQPIYYKALVLRRMGKWDESQRLMRLAISYDVREPLFLTNIGLSYAYLHNYDSAIYFHQKAIDLVPAWISPYKNKFDAHILKGGSLRAAQSILDEAVRQTGNSMVEDYILLDTYLGKYEEAIDLASLSTRRDFFIPAQKFISLGQLFKLTGRTDLSKHYFDTASVMLLEDLHRRPKDQYLHALLGIVYSNLGYPDKATDEGYRAVEIASGKNFMDESDMRLYLAQIFVTNGDLLNAAPVVIKLLNSPSMLSENILNLDPVWEPLMKRQEYRKKIKNYSNN